MDSVGPKCRIGDPPRVSRAPPRHPGRGQWPLWGPRYATAPQDMSENGPLTRSIRLYVSCHPCALGGVAGHQASGPRESTHAPLPRDCSPAPSAMPLLLAARTGARTLLGLRRRVRALLGLTPNPADRLSGTWPTAATSSGHAHRLPSPSLVPAVLKLEAPVSIPLVRHGFLGARNQPAGTSRAAVLVTGCSGILFP